jgi:preprotein translocase subunit SecD
MFALRYTAVLILIVASALGFFIYKTSTPAYQAAQGKFAFKLGLDLSGGTQLVYDADISKVPAANVNDSLTALQTVIERRVNAFGVSEPVVQLEQGGALGNGTHRLIVELPGITDVNQAIKLIGQTPTLDFKLINKGYEASTTITLPNGTTVINPAAFTDTGLTGEFLASASLQFGNGSGALSSAPVVQVNFNQQGAKLFAQITDANVGRQLGIFLDGLFLLRPSSKKSTAVLPLSRVTLVPKPQSLWQPTLTLVPCRYLLNSTRLKPLAQHLALKRFMQAYLPVWLALLSCLYL